MCSVSVVNLELMCYLKRGIAISTVVEDPLGKDINATEEQWRLILSMPTTHKCRLARLGTIDLCGPGV